MEKKQFWKTINDWISGPIAWMAIGAIIVWVWSVYQADRHQKTAAAQAATRTVKKSAPLYPVTKATVMPVENGEAIVLQVPVPSALSEVSTVKTCIVFRDLVTRSSSISCEQGGDFNLQNDD